MDHDRFDTLSRALGMGPSRRQALKLLGGSLASGLLATLGIRSARAKEERMHPVPPAHQAMLETFQQHLMAEVTGDIEAALATMTENPYVNHVPVLTGGVGRAGVRQFYRDHLVGKLFPPDVELITVSRTVGRHQLVDEVVAKFTHTQPIDWMLPGVPPTCKRVEVAVVVIIKFEADKVAHEHIYWDQASVLVQLGLLDPTGLPVSGIESAHKVLDPTLPPRPM